MVVATKVMGRMHVGPNGAGASRGHILAQVEKSLERLGTGHIDWATVCHGLAAVQYKGPITLEPFRRDDDRIGVPLAQWRAPTRDEDKDIRNWLRRGLRFSRPGRRCAANWRQQRSRQQRSSITP